MGHRHDGRGPMHSGDPRASIRERAYDHGSRHRGASWHDEADTIRARSSPPWELDPDRDGRGQSRPRDLDARGRFVSRDDADGRDPRLEGTGGHPSFAGHREQDELRRLRSGERLDHYAALDREPDHERWERRRMDAWDRIDDRGDVADRRPGQSGGAGDRDRDGLRKPRWHDDDRERWLVDDRIPEDERYRRGHGRWSYQARRGER